MTDEEFARAEIAHDTLMEDMAIYRGHARAEVESWINEPPCPHRYTDFEADECWSGNCSLAYMELHDAIASRAEPEVIDTRESHQGNGGWCAEVVNLWHLVLHGFR